MTVQYDGGDTYTIYYEHKVYKLPKALIDEIQEFDFIYMNDKESVTQLKDKIYELECTIENLEDSLELQDIIEELRERLNES